MEALVVKPAHRIHDTLSEAFHVGFVEVILVTTAVRAVGFGPGRTIFVVGLNGVANGKGHFATWLFVIVVVFPFLSLSTLDEGMCASPRV
jgi:hypothetical protein